MHLTAEIAEDAEGRSNILIQIYFIISMVK